MKHAIIFITVFFSAVDLSFSIECYQCDPSDNKKLCRDASPSKCGNDSFCVIETKQRGDTDHNLACVGPQDSYDCKKGSYVCNYCQYDKCNKPPTRPFERLSQCYEDYWEGEEEYEIPTPEIFQKMSEFLTRKFCGIEQKCMTATVIDGDVRKKLYRGCTILPPDEICTRYNFTACASCDGDLCNKPKDYEPKEGDKPVECFECFTGPKKEDIFLGLASCENASKVLCGVSEKCVRGLGKVEGRRFHGCFKYDEDTFRKKFGFTNVTFCSKNLCNKIKEDPPTIECYECYRGDTDDNFKNKRTCPRWAKRKCPAGFKCVTASSEDKLYHGCADEKKFCKQYDFDDCQVCGKNLCNEVHRPTSNSLKCYECYTKDASSAGSIYARYFKGKASCSDPSTSTCASNQQCVHAHGTHGHFHGCLVKTEDSDKDCTDKGFTHCSFCNKDLCNEVEESEYSSPRKQENSSAVTLTINSVLIIFVIFRAACFCLNV